MAENKFFSSPSVDIIESSTKIIGDIFSEADLELMVSLREISLQLEKLLLENLAKSTVKSIVQMLIFRAQFQVRLKLMKYSR